MEPELHGSKGDDPVEQALGHIKKAERDLERAHEEEHRAEEELLDAEQELEEAHRHEWEIIVNSRPKVVKERELTFEQVVELAFPGCGSEQNVVFSVTYRHAASHPHSGELAAGGVVKVKDGTVFNVTKTIKS